MKGQLFEGSQMVSDRYWPTLDDDILRVFADALMKRVTLLFDFSERHCASHFGRIGTTATDHHQVATVVCSVAVTVPYT
jgi:hypothetical protein